MAVISRFPAVLLPAVGALLGLCGGLFILLLPKGPGAVAALSLWTAVTLASGERGFARWFMQLPLFGSLLAGISILLRWYALISLHGPPKRMMLAVAACMALGQAAGVALGWVSRPVDDAAVARLRTLNTLQTGAAIALAVAVCLPFGVPVALILVLLSYVLIRLVSWFLNWRLGGVRASDLEAQRILAETTGFVLLASLMPGT